MFIIFLPLFFLAGIDTDSPAHLAVIPISEEIKVANISIVTPANESSNKITSSETKTDTSITAPTTYATNPDENEKTINSGETHLHVVSDTNIESSSVPNNQINLSVTMNNSNSNEEKVAMNSATINVEPLIVSTTSSLLSTSSSSLSSLPTMDDVPKNIDSMKSEESSLHSDSTDDNFSSSTFGNERKSFEVIRGRALDLSSPSLMNPEAEKTSKIVYVTAPPNSTTISTVRPKIKSIDDLSDVSMDDIEFDSFNIGRNSEGMTDNQEKISKNDCEKVSSSYGFVM